MTDFRASFHAVAVTFHGPKTAEKYSVLWLYVPGRRRTAVGRMEDGSGFHGPFRLLMISKAF
jgi:hypothetical protein